MPYTSSNMSKTDTNPVRLTSPDTRHKSVHWRGLSSQYSDGQGLITYIDGTLVLDTDERYSEGLPGGIIRDKRKSKKLSCLPKEVMDEYWRRHIKTKFVYRDGWIQ